MNTKELLKLAEQSFDSYFCKQPLMEDLLITVYSLKIGLRNVFWMTNMQFVFVCSWLQLTFSLLSKRGQFDSKKIIKLIKFYAGLRRESVLTTTFFFRYIMSNFDRNRLRSRIKHTDICDSIIIIQHKMNLCLRRKKFILAAQRGWSETLRFGKTRNFEMNSLRTVDG